MGHAKSGRFRVPRVAALLVVLTGLVLLQSGIGLLTTFLSVVFLAILVWLFTREPRPEGEIPCTSVSCCHFLGDAGNERSEQPDQGHSD